jgi:hypothetical protein
MIFEPATSERVREFLGKIPDYSLQGYVGVDDDEPKILYGVYRCNDALVGFMDAKPAIRPRDIVKGSKLFLDLLKKKNTRVFAIRDPEKVTAEAFLKHLGFQHLQGNLYEWLP